jgi:phage recombination protein Bet
MPDDFIEQEEQPRNQLQLRGPRLAYPSAVKEKYGVDIGTWKVLVEAVWPEAQEVESIGLALAYCKARGLDPLKRVVHIVPVWDGRNKRMRDTLWPGISELRTTAFRTKGYAGQEPAVYGPDVTRVWNNGTKEMQTITFPEWCQITVYRTVGGRRCAFAGPRTYWLEEFASRKDGSPNSMWTKRPRGQLTKCAEAAALRLTFPEELGDELTEIDGPTVVQYGDNGLPPSPQNEHRSLALLNEGTNGTTEGHDRGTVPQSEQESGQPSGLPGQVDSGGNGVRNSGLDQGDTKGGKVPQSEHQATAKQTNTGGNGPTGNGVAVGSDTPNIPWTEFEKEQI